MSPSESVIAQVIESVAGMFPTAGACSFPAVTVRWWPWKTRPQELPVAETGAFLLVEVHDVSRLALVSERPGR